MSEVVPDTFVHAHPDHPLDVVLDRLLESGGVLPVVSRTAAMRVEGVITRDSMLASWGLAAADQPIRAGTRAQADL